MLNANTFLSSPPAWFELWEFITLRSGDLSHLWSWRLNYSNLFMHLNCKFEKKKKNLIFFICTFNCGMNHAYKCNLFRKKVKMRSQSILKSLTGGRYTGLWGQRSAAFYTEGVIRHSEQVCLWDTGADAGARPAGILQQVKVGNDQIGQTAETSKRKHKQTQWSVSPYL